jgi:FtsP/CotA-like multicopper oxidase with cupredoxin domain
MAERVRSLPVALLMTTLIATPALAPGGSNWPICRHPAASELAALATSPADGAGASACARPVAGAVIAPPADLYSQNGALTVNLHYVTSTDAAGRTLFCFVTPDGHESPTLHVRPGDTLIINLTNRVTTASGAAPATTMVSLGTNVCGAATGNVTSVNIHFHGTNTAPTCHSDEVIHTTVNGGQTFRYRVAFPADEPPGLYWYHPHIHGMSEAAVQGGASGAIVVEGIERIQPAVAGLPARVLVIRDQTVAGSPNPGGRIPSWDLSLNYVPIAYPALTPAVLPVTPGRREFWRVLNASADTIADIHLSYDGVDQPLEIVALDGVATGSQDGTGAGALVTRKHILIPPAGRAEFIVTAPAAGVRRAILATQAIDTGPDGDNDTTRTLAVLSGATPASAPAAPVAATMAGPSSGVPVTPRFAGLDTAPVTARRKLYFSEVLQDPNNPAGPTNFYITVDGATPTLFDPANPPAITTTQGAVEQWTIENRALENHEFHMHQIHFQLMARNGLTVPKDQRQFYDTIQVPYWKGSGPYPSVTVLMDFRGNITGDFVYHCHILGHEDNGMMAIIRVLPKPRAAAVKAAR